MFSILKVGQGWKQKSENKTMQIGNIQKLILLVFKYKTKAGYLTIEK